jgi:dTDP-glucose 4,6-dehydratase
MMFFMDNCIGTVNLLNYARAGGLIEGGKFLYFSTDEVFGPAPFDSEVGFKEWDRLNPNNPYAAAKAAAEMAVISFANTYKIPCVITNTMNIYGERQSPEKYIPLVINKVLSGEKLLVHANKDKTQAGKRHYLHARNICAATVWVLENGKTLDGSAKQGRYNIVGEVEMDNLSLAKLVAEITNEWLQEQKTSAPERPLNFELVDFHSSRPGHDLRYALDGAHLHEEGFSYPAAFEESLRKMVYWTLDHADKWL